MFINFTIKSLNFFYEKLKSFSLSKRSSFHQRCIYFTNNTSSWFENLLKLSIKTFTASLFAENLSSEIFNVQIVWCNLNFVNQPGALKSEFPFNYWLNSKGFSHRINPNIGIFLICIIKIMIAKCRIFIFLSLLKFYLYICIYIYRQENIIIR